MNSNWSCFHSWFFWGRDWKKVEGFCQSISGPLSRISGQHQIAQQQGKEKYITPFYVFMTFSFMSCLREVCLNSCSPLPGDFTVLIEILGEKEN